MRFIHHNFGYKSKYSNKCRYFLFCVYCVVYETATYKKSVSGKYTQWVQLESKFTTDGKKLFCRWKLLFSLYKKLLTSTRRIIGQYRKSTKNVVKKVNVRNNLLKINIFFYLNSLLFYLIS